MLTLDTSPLPSIRAFAEVYSTPDRLRRWLDQVISGSPASAEPQSRKRDRQESASPSRQVKRLISSARTRHLMLPMPADSMDTDHDDPLSRDMPVRSVLSPTRSSRRAESPTKRARLPPRSPAASSSASSSSSEFRQPQQMGSIAETITTVPDLRPVDSISNDGRRGKAARSRSNSPRKRQQKVPLEQLLMEKLNPPVVYNKLREWLNAEEGNCLPPAAQKLSNCIAVATHEEACVPATLRPRFERWLEHVGQKFRSRDSMYYEYDAQNEWDDELWQTVRKIIEKSLKTRERTEAELTAITVNRILDLVVDDRDQVAQCQLRKTDSPVQALNVTTTPTVLRADSTVVSRPISDEELALDEAETIDNAISRKRIDHVLSIPFHNSFKLELMSHDENKARNRALGIVCASKGYTSSINQTEAFPHDAFLAGIEVKKERSSVPPEIQLAAWLSIGQYHAQQLGFAIDVPRVAISVVGHHWNVYVACPIQEGKLLLCVGPTEIGSTQSEEGIFRIVHVLREIVKWGNTEFRPMIEDGIIGKLVIPAANE